MILNQEKTQAATDLVVSLRSYVDGIASGDPVVMPEQVAAWSNALGADRVHRELAHWRAAYAQSFDKLRDVDAAADPALTSQAALSYRLMADCATSRFSDLIQRFAPDSQATEV
jgi:hypothetical protein